MKLTIQNIENIIGRKLPNLDGWSIGDIEYINNHYEIDIKNNHTLKIVLYVHRDSNTYADNYTCTLLGGNGSKYKYELHRDEFKTKLGFIKCVAEMVRKFKQDIDQQNFIASLPSVSAGTHITQSYNPF